MVDMNPGWRQATLLAVGLMVTGLSSPWLSAQAPASRDTLLAAAREIVEAARYCGLVTFDGSGDARVRTMDPFLPGDDWSIWMGTRRGSRKVRDIEADPRVVLYYEVPERGGYVAIHGTASLVDDPEEKATRWKDEWAAFYTDRETQYLLIRVIAERLEVIDYSRGIGGDPETWEPPMVEFPGG
jgi:general stress protein 26